MDSATLGGLVQLVGLVTQDCWTIGSKLYELQKQKTEIEETLVSTSDEVKALRKSLESFHNTLRKLATRNIDPDDYQDVWDAVCGPVDDCQAYLKTFVEFLDRIRGNEPQADNHLAAFKLRVHKEELQKNMLEVQGQKMSMNVCLTMLIVQICADLAMRDDTSYEVRSDQLPVANKKLASAMRKLSNSDSCESVDSHHTYRLKETAEKVLSGARLINTQSATTYAGAIRDFTNLSMDGRHIGQEDRNGIETWIRQLQPVEEDLEDDFEEEPTSPLASPVSPPVARIPSNKTSPPIEYRPQSQLPEVHMQPTRLLSVDENASVGDTVSTHDRFYEDYDDDLNRDLVRQLSDLGREHFHKNNISQATDSLEKALHYANSLPSSSYADPDVAEVRNILGSIYLQKQDYAVAESYFSSVIELTVPNESTDPIITGAHYQLAQLFLKRRDFDQAQIHCRKSLSGRIRVYGKASHEYFQALSLLAQIFHGEGKILEADVTINRLPLELQAQTKERIQEQVNCTSPPPGSPPASIRGSTASPTAMSPSSPPPQSFRFHSFSRPRGSLPIIRRSSALSQTENGSDRSSMFTRRTSNTRNTSISNVPPPSWKGDHDFDFNETAGDARKEKLASGGFSGDYNAAKALSWAIEQGDDKIVNLLLEGYAIARPKRRFSVGSDSGYITKKIGPDGGKGEKEPPLIYAILFGQVMIVRPLLERGAKHHITDAKGRTPLVVAAECGYTEIIQLLLNHGFPLDVKNDERSWSSWHAAAQNGHEDVIRLYLSRGVSVDAQDRIGNTALKLAAGLGHMSLCELLIENGADVSVCSDDGWTALHSSVKSGHQLVSRLLIAKGCSLDHQNSKSQSPLTIAAREGRKAETRTLAEAGASVDLPDQHGWTPLMIACDRGHTEVAEALLEHKANVNAHCPKNSTPLDHAVSHRHRDIELMLRNSGAMKGSGLVHVSVQVADAFKGYGGF